MIKEQETLCFNCAGQEEYFVGKLHLRFPWQLKHCKVRSFTKWENVICSNEKFEVKMKWLPQGHRDRRTESRRVRLSTIWSILSLEADLLNSWNIYFGDRLKKKKKASVKKNIFFIISFAELGGME